MSRFDDEQSEDGELAQSPQFARMDFSLSSEGEAEVDADSLDIKPPQALVSRSRHHSGRSRSHRRTRKEEDRRVVPSSRSHRDSKHSHRDKPKMEVDQLYYSREQRYAPYKEKPSGRNSHFRERERDDFYRDKSRTVGRHKYPEDRHLEKENRDRLTGGDRELEDLRSRLLSKRQTKERMDADQRRDDSPEPRAGDRKPDRRDRLKTADRDTARRRSEEELEISPEPQQFPARLPELDPMQLERREKLLKTEREMSHRKKTSRAALAARREKLKENAGKRTGDSPLGIHKKKRHRSGPPSPQTPSDVVTVSDASDTENKADGSEKSENSEEGENTGSSSESSSESTGEESGSEEEEENEENDDDDVQPVQKNTKHHIHHSDQDMDLDGPITEPSSPRNVDTSPATARSDTPQHDAYRENVSRSLSRSRSRSFSPPPAHGLQENGTTADIQSEEPAPATPPPSPPDERDSLPPYFPAIQGCRSVEEFQCLNRIEEGTYGVVYRARDKTTDEIVALKRLKMEKEKEGFPITSLREINTLLKGQHPNIVTVREIVVGSNMDKIFIVMDYVEHDLKGLMETMRARKRVFTPGQIKCLMQQLLRAVSHLHDNWILHRDLKTSNLLLSHKGILKVGDFGLAREYGSPLKNYTPVVVTLWYRAPELLLGTKTYSTPIDIWSVGCIFAEFITMHALFQGKSDVDQLNKIFKELGTPNETIWPGWSQLSGARATWADQPGGGLRAKVGNNLSEMGLRLLIGLLTYDPQKRFTAYDALIHEYFMEQPLAIDPAMFPTWPAKSEGGRRHQHSPKPPSGGDQYKLLRDEDQALGFHMGQPTLGTGSFLPPTASTFSLKF